MKSKLKFIVPLVLVIVGGAYKFVLAKPAKAAKPKVHGEVYILPKEFLVNLQDGRFAKLQVGLVIDADKVIPAEGGGHDPAAAEPPEGFGLNPQEGLVRDLVTDELTDSPADDLIDAGHRAELKERLAKRINKTTDVPVEHVLLTDITVQ